MLDNAPTLDDKCIDFEEDEDYQSEINLKDTKFSVTFTKDLTMRNLKFIGLDDIDHNFQFKDDFSSDSMA